MSLAAEELVRSLDNGVVTLQSDDVTPQVSLQTSDTSS